MTDLTLPGDIPGLLRRGSPIVGGGVVLEMDGDTVHVGWQVEHLKGAPDLDLRDATGRAHAAWWLIAQPLPEKTEIYLHRAAQIWLCPYLSDRESEHAWVAVRMLPGIGDLQWHPYGDHDAEALRLVCLHVAERS